MTLLRLLAFALPVHVLAAPYSGTVYVYQTGGGNDPSEVRVELGESASAGVLVDEPKSNRGDYWLEFPDIDELQTGALLVTAAERTRNNSGVGDSAGSLQATASIAPVEAEGQYALSLHRIGSNEEYNMNVSFALFPYDEFLAGVTKMVGQSPAVLSSLSASDGIEVGAGKEVAEVEPGKVRVDLTSLGASSNDGILLASGAENDDNVVLVTPNADGSFFIRTRDNNTNGPDPLEPGAVSFAYLPMDEVGQAGSRVVAAGRIHTETMFSIAGGEFMLTKGDTGFWYLSSPGYDASNATLLVSAVWDPDSGSSVDNFVATEWIADENCWEISSNDLPSGGAQDGTTHELMFSFALMAKETIAEPFALDLLEAPVAREIMPHGDSLIGNGIDTATGSFVQGRELLSVEGVRPLSFDVIYDSCFTSKMGPMGTSWRHNYEARLFGTLGRDVVVQWDAHRYSRFKYVDEGNGQYRYEGQDEDVLHAELYLSKPHPVIPPGSWILNLEDGTTYKFGKDGRLASEINVVGQVIEPRYDAEGRLTRLVEPYSGVSLFLGYNEAGLVNSITDDLGRMVTLSYDDQGRLLTIPAPFFPEEDEVGSDIAARAIPDGNAEGLELYIDVTEGGAIGGIVARALKLEHPRPSDLAITIVSPAGTPLDVPAQATQGATTIDYADTFFEAFEGEDRRGRWTLKVVDSQVGGTGSVQAFKLSFSDSTRAVSYTYDASNRITKAEDSLGVMLLEAEYDVDGRLVRQADGRPDTPDVTVRYEGFDSDGTRRSTYTDRLGYEWVFEHDAGYRLLKAIDPLGNESTFTYNDEGRRLTAVDAKGRTTRFTYDDKGDLETMTDASGATTTFDFNARHQIVSITDALGRETTMLYMNDRLVTVTDALGNTDKKEYHNNGQVKKVIMSDQAFMEYKLDAQGRTGRISNPEYGDQEQNLNYDLAGRLIRSTDFGGNETQLFYNASGEIRKQIDPEGNVSRWEYDHRGRLIKEVDERGFATTYEYDGNGNTISSTNAIGETSAFVYDADDRLLSSTNAKGATVNREYDALGRLVAITDPLGRKTQTVYDKTGNVVRTIDAFGVTSLTVEYDERDLPVRVTDSLGHSVSTTYDEVMRKTETRDELGRVTTYEYDDLDRLLSVTGPSGRQSKAQYMSDDVMNRFQPPGEREVSLLYDRSNNLKKVQLYSGSSVEYSYNSRGLLSRKLTEGNHNILYYYDDVGRLEEVEPSSSSDLHRAYEYDQAGNLLAVGTRTSVGGSIAPRIKRTYDPLGRLATYTNSNDETLVYLYDQAGNLLGLVYPDGSEVTYTYDLANRLVKVVDWDERETRFEWDLNDRLTRIDFPNGAYREMLYDTVGNIRIRNDYAADGTVILSYSYGYDAVGQLQSELVSPEIEPAIPTPATYTYNSEGELETQNGQDVGMTRDGQMLRGPSGTNLQGLLYNVWGQMYLSGDYFYFYDQEDKLVGWERRGTSEGRTEFFVNPASGLSQILTSLDPEDNLKRYVYGVGLLYEEDASTGDIRVFHYDHRGSAVAFSDSAGALMGRVTYAPYGEITHRNGDTDTMFLFNGLYGVVTTPEELVHMRHRWYSPIARRFLTRDTRFGSIGELSSMNRYVYAGGNPAMRVDPEGELWWVAAGAAIGSAVNVGVTFLVDISDGSIDESAATYWSAAISGAVSGAIIAGTGGLGGAVLAGAAGSLTENLAYAGLTGGELNARDLAVGAALGGAFGAAGHGAGKVAGKVSNKLYSKTFGQPGRFSKFVNKMTIPDKVSRRRAVGSFGELVKRSASTEAKQSLMKVAKGYASHYAGVVGANAWGAFSSWLSSAPSSGGGSGTGTYQIIVESHQALNGKRLKEYGEYIHYDIFLDAVRLADRPVPSHPNNTLTGF